MYENFAHCTISRVRKDRCPVYLILQSKFPSKFNLQGYNFRKHENDKEKTFNLTSIKSRSEKIGPITAKKTGKPRWKWCHLWMKNWKLRANEGNWWKIAKIVKTSNKTRYQSLQSRGMLHYHPTRERPEHRTAQGVLWYTKAKALKPQPPRT